MAIVITTENTHAATITSIGIERDFPWPFSFLSTSWSCKLGNCPSAATFRLDWAASAETRRATLRAGGGTAGGDSSRRRDRRHGRH